MSRLYRLIIWQCWSMSYWWGECHSHILYYWLLYGILSDASNTLYNVGQWNKASFSESICTQPCSVMPYAVSQLSSLFDCWCRGTVFVVIGHHVSLNLFKAEFAGEKRHQLRIYYFFNLVIVRDSNPCSIDNCMDIRK